ncbi:MAG: YqaE/Pmp3 family membrane protein [Desulfococcaceae bacterium]
MASEGTKDFIRIILSVIIPPVGVFFQVGIGLHFWINILLTLLGYIPGLLHAIWIIVKKD